VDGHGYLGWSDAALARFVGHRRSFRIAQRRDGAAWPERDAVSDGRLPGDTKIGGVLDPERLSGTMP
jgi:hypothetical protein